MSAHSFFFFFCTLFLMAIYYSISVWTVHFKKYSLNGGHLASQIFVTTDTCKMNILIQVNFCVLL